MISMNKKQLPVASWQLPVASKLQTANCSQSPADKLQTVFRFLYLGSYILVLGIFFSSCGIYTFKDVSIPPEVKTVKINFIENRASYKNQQLCREHFRYQQPASRYQPINSGCAHNFAQYIKE